MRSILYPIARFKPDTIPVTALSRLILMTKTEMLRKLIEDGLSNTTKPKDRLAIYIKLNELVDRLTGSLHIESQFEKEAHEFLKRGPVLVKAKSRFTATERTVTYETEG